MFSTHKRPSLLVSTALCLWILAGVALAQDPGKEKIGTLKAQLIYASNGKAEELSGSTKLLEAAEKELLEKSIRKKFKEYRKLGEDQKKILRGYENWTSSMTGSEQLMVSFEPKGREGKDGLRLDLELWQSKRKVLKADPVLRMGKHLYIVGPKWRGGQLIIVLELVDLLAE